MRTGLLVVDVQPYFDSDCRFVANRIAQRINNTRKPTTVMWVGSGVCDDDEFSVRDYLRAHGARPGRLDSCVFVEKSYGFLRPWMDSGVPHDVIVDVGRTMMKTSGCRSSADVDLSQWESSYDLSATDIFLPNFEVRSFNGFDAFETCGGGNHECLAEIELWLSMKSKFVKRLDHLVYG